MNLKQFDTSMRIVKEVSKTYNIPLKVLDSKSRRGDLVEARQVIMFLIRRHTHLSSSQIGLILGKDHGTVLMGCKRINNRLATERKLLNTVQEIHQRVRQGSRKEVRGVIIKFGPIMP